MVKYLNTVVEVFVTTLVIDIMLLCIRQNIVNLWLLRCFRSLQRCCTLRSSGFSETLSFFMYVPFRVSNLVAYAVNSDVVLETQVLVSRRLETQFFKSVSVLEP